MKKAWLKTYKKEPIVIESSDSNFETSDGDDGDEMPVIIGPKKRRPSLNLR